MSQSSQHKAPVFKQRLGSVQAAIWESENGEDNKGFSVTFSRSYKDKDDKWQNTDFMNPGDLPIVAKLADICLTWIVREQQKGDRR